jgi:hypothetical protein
MAHLSFCELRGRSAAEVYSDRHAIGSTAIIIKQIQGKHKENFAARKRTRQSGVYRSVV